MLDLSPTKLFVILIVAVIIVGPRRLPRVAHELARGWRRLRELHTEIDREVRQTVPGLPPNLDLVRYARSPVALLNRFADALPAEAHQTVDEASPATGGPQEDRVRRTEFEGFGAVHAGPGAGDPYAASTGGGERAAISRTRRTVGEALLADDPSMN